MEKMLNELEICSIKNRCPVECRNRWMTSSVCWPGHWTSIWILNNNSCWTHRMSSCHWKHWRANLSLEKKFYRWTMPDYASHLKEIFLSTKNSRGHCEFVLLLRSPSSYFSLSFLQSALEPLASFGSSLNTNLSRSISLTWLDNEGNDIPLLTDVDHPFEIVIPRDPLLIIPPMSLYNVTGQQGFHFHSIDLSQTSSSVSMHWEIHPLNINLSYAFIYRFDRAPSLNSSRPQIDGWTIFSPSSNAYRHGCLCRDTSSSRSRFVKWQTFYLFLG